MISEEDDEIAQKINEKARRKPEIKILEDILVGDIAQQLVKVQKDINHHRNGNKAVPDGVEQPVLLQHHHLHQQVKTDACNANNRHQLFAGILKQAPVVQSQNPKRDKRMDVIEPVGIVIPNGHQETGCQHQQKSQYIVPLQKPDAAVVLRFCKQHHRNQVKQVSQGLQVVAKKVMGGQLAAVLVDEG